MEERWLPVPGTDGRYEVSDMGRVRSLFTRGYGYSNRRATPKVLRLHIRYGYPCIGLGTKGLYYHGRVHNLVLMAFVGPRPDGMYGTHKNGIREDSRLENLEWKTPAGNYADMFRHGTAPINDRNSNTVLRASDVAEIRAAAARGERLCNIAVRYGVCHQHVGDIVRRVKRRFA